MFWTDLPIGRVVRVVDIDLEEIALAAVDAGPAGPVVLTCRLPASGGTGDIVNGLLDELTATALALFPRWLPGLSGDPGVGVDTESVRRAARRLAQTSRHYGPFLRDLAEAGHAGGPPACGQPAEVRAAGLARVLADAFAQQAVALLVAVPEEICPERAAAVGAAAEWLARWGGFGVWLHGGRRDVLEDVPWVRIDLPREVGSRPGRAVVEVDEPAVTVLHPPLAGSPNPTSAAERFLEAGLARHGWATGRQWNRAFRSPDIPALIRPDVHWPRERCVVEVDGPEHRGPLRFAADRQRDVLLQLAGVTVLRFTNAQVLNDLDLVLSQIERCLRARRQ